MSFKFESALNYNQKHCAHIVHLIHTCCHQFFSFRVLRSLQEFANLVVIESADHVEIYPATNFALQIQDVDSADFEGQTFNVRLGSVEEAVGSTSDIDPAALVTAMEIDSGSTGYLDLPPALLPFGSGLRRLSYAVYISTSFFPTGSPNTTVASIVLAALLGGQSPSGTKRQSEEAADLDTDITVGFMTVSLPVSQ